MRAPSWLAVAIGCALGFVVAQVQAIAGTTGQGIVGGGNCASSSAGCKAASFSTSGSANVGGVVDAGYAVFADTVTISMTDGGTAIRIPNGVIVLNTVSAGDVTTIGNGAQNALYPGVWFVANPSLSNFAFLSDNHANTIFNAPSGGFDSFRVGNQTIVIVSASGVQNIPRILPTCTSALVGTEAVDIYSGDGGVRTKKCMCTSNGIDGGATMAWQNEITATIGNTTLCGAE